MEQNSNETTAPETGAHSEQAAEQPVAENAAAAPRRRSRRATAATGEVVAPPAEAAPAASAADEAAAEAPAPKKRVTRSRKKVVEADVEAAPTATVEGDGVAEAPGAVDTITDAPAEAAPKRRTSRSRKKAAEPEATETTAATEQVSDAVAANEPVTTPAQAADVQANAAENQVERVATDSVDAADAVNAALDAVAAGAEPGEAAKPAQRQTRQRGSRRGQARGGDQPSGNETAHATGSTDAGEQGTEAPTDGENGANGDGNGANGNGNGRAADAGTRPSRTRQRERKRRGQGDDLEPEITVDDVLLPVAGILDVLDNYAFVRTSGYLPGTNDVYVSLGQVKKYGLRKGDAVVGAIRQPRDGEGAGRQKYNAIVKVDSVNARPVDDEQTRIEFADLTAIHPDQRLKLETDREQLTQRAIDLFTPIGFGQRGVIAGPQGSGRTAVLQAIAAGVAHNHADAHLMLVLVDARPEEVTELQRTVNGEVIASTFDRQADDHTTVAELAVERAKRLVELGHDVVVLFDSVTALGRAYQQSGPAAARLAAGFDTTVLAPVKRLLSAARNLENGGSLTILATAGDRSVSNTDELILEELAGVWNLQVKLDADLAAQRIFPALDIAASETRRADLIAGEAEVSVVNGVRRSVAEAGAQQGLEAVLTKLAGTASNAEFLAQSQRAVRLS